MLPSNLFGFLTIYLVMGVFVALGYSTPLGVPGMHKTFGIFTTVVIAVFTVFVWPILIRNELKRI